MEQGRETDGLITRERGDDIEVIVRFRKSFFRLLTEGWLVVNGNMQLVHDGDAYAICIWSAEMPTWPDPVPGNSAAAAEREARDGAK